MNDPRAVRDLERLKWLGVTMPIAFIWGFELIRYFVLDGRPANHEAHLVAALVMGGAVVAFGLAMAVLLDRTQREMIRQNRDLTARQAVGTAIRGGGALPEAAAEALERMVEQTGALAGVVRVSNGDDGFEASRPEAATGRLPWLRPLLDEPVHGVRTIRFTDRPELDTVVLDLGFTDGAGWLGYMRLLFHPPLRPPLSSDALVAIAGEMSTTIRLSHAMADLERRERERAALHEVALQLTGRTATREVLDTIARHAHELLAADRAAVCLAEDRAGHRNGEQTGRVALTSEGGTEVLTHIGDGLGHPQNPLCPLRSGDPSSHWMSSPLRGPDGPLGELCVARTAGAPFSDRERRLLGAFADMAAIAVRTARLIEAEQQWAVLAERDRIARELHDSLAQVLGHIHLRLRALQESLDGATPVVADQLEDIAGVADEAYQDVREAILGLRETIAPDKGLEGALREYLAKYSRQTGIKTSLECDGVAHDLLPPRAEVQLLRVVQEALTNVRKHARASRAVVGIGLEDGVATLTVEDDGDGFDPARIDESFTGGFGLSSMHERVEQVGATLDVDTGVGQGTRVVVRFGRKEVGVAPATSSAGSAR